MAFKKTFKPKAAAKKVRDIYVVCQTPVNGEPIEFIAMDQYRWNVVIDEPRVVARATAGSETSLDSQVVFSVIGSDAVLGDVRAVVVTDPRNQDELIVQEMHITPLPKAEEPPVSA